MPVLFTQDVRYACGDIKGEHNCTMITLIREKKYIYPEQEHEGLRIFTAFLFNVVT